MSAATTNGGAPTWGDAVERWAAEHLGLSLEDASSFDARTADGTPTQVKGCREQVGDEYPRSGRFRLWSEELVHLLADDGLYLFVLYDEEADPSMLEFAERFKLVPASTAGELAGGYWSAGSHRPGKGRQAKVPWREVWPDG